MTNTYIQITDYKYYCICVQNYINNTHSHTINFSYISPNNLLKL